LVAAGRRRARDPEAARRPEVLDELLAFYQKGKAYKPGQGK
jgi:hypothetical protein